MKIDIRETLEETTEIIFADPYGYDINSISVVERGIAFNCCEGAELYLQSEGDAQNLIKALRKAIELGWFDKD